MAKKPDPTALRPSELVRLFNSTPLGEVLTSSQLHRQRNQAGYRIGEGDTVDFARYVMWLAREWHGQQPEAEKQTYAERKAHIAARERVRSAAGRDIGPLPDVVNPKRRKGCRSKLQRFLETYFASTFHLPWSKDHPKIIGRIEQAVLRGGLFALATPRGSGKTSLCERACLWALLYGHRRFVALIGSDEGHAVNMLENIKTELEQNALLLEDFPEVCHPIHKLEGIPNRAAGQLLDGERTHIGWMGKRVILPIVPSGAASGGMIQVAGLTGRIRGMMYLTAAGESIRPDLVITDDPQTDESARSVSQSRNREHILAGAVLGLAGPTEKISGVMPCTVIYPGDMADRILDRDQHPEWNGERTKMVYKFPTNEKLWEQYEEIWADSHRAGNEGAEATAFYGANRAAMDAGAEIAWPERFNKDELSAIQHAMNLRLRDEQSFWAEYQNEPRTDERGEVDLLDADDVAGKTNRRERGSVPLRCEYVTAFVDLHKAILYYTVCAWQGDFTGYVIDYGTYPDQERAYFALSDVQRTLAQVHKGVGADGALYAGLGALVGRLMGTEWKRDDKVVMRIDRMHLDQGWKAELVHQFCRESEHAATLMPARGSFIGASHRPVSEYDRKKGDRIGHHWWVPSPKGRRALRHVEVDVNYWKTFVHDRLATVAGESGCMSIFGGKPGPHRMFAEHLTAEFRVQTSGRGRTLDEWKLPVRQPDNHFFDCVVGCAAAASMLGAQRVGAPTTPGPIPQSERPSFAAQFAARRRG